VIACGFSGDSAFFATTFCCNKRVFGMCTATKLEIDRNGKFS
jgi:hypothetical protein